MARSITAALILLVAAPAFAGRGLRLDPYVVANRINSNRGYTDLYRLEPSYSTSWYPSLQDREVNDWVHQHKQGLEEAVAERCADGDCDAFNHIAGATTESGSSGQIVVMARSRCAQNRRDIVKVEVKLKRTVDGRRVLAAFMVPLAAGLLLLWLVRRASAAAEDQEQAREPSLLRPDPASADAGSPRFRSPSPAAPPQPDYRRLLVLAACYVLLSAVVVAAAAYRSAQPVIDEDQVMISLRIVCNLLEETDISGLLGNC